MKNYLLAFLVLLFPVYSFAKDDHLPKKKIYLIEEAERHKNEAIKALKAADEMSVLIPNPEDQKHMHTLIVTTIGSLGSPGDIKTKIIVSATQRVSCFLRGSSCFCEAKTTRD